MTNEDKAKQLGNGIDSVRDPYVRVSLELRQAFGNEITSPDRE